MLLLEFKAPLWFSVCLLQFRHSPSTSVSQCVLVTILLLLLALGLLVLAVLTAENAGPLSCGLRHMCCCVRHARLFGSIRRLLLRMLSCTLPLQMAFLAPMDHVFFQFLLMCVHPPHAVPMKYVLFISSAVQLWMFRSRQAITDTKCKNDPWHNLLFSWDTYSSSSWKCGSIHLFCF